MSQDFEDKVVLVTGAASGIGRACTIAFAREGAKIVVADLAVEGGEETAHLICKSGGEAIFQRCNVTDSSDVSTLIDVTKCTYDRLDCACNNAGIEGAPALTADYPEDVWRRVIK